MEKNKFHILVVDDDDKIRNLIKQFLNEKGFIVSTAINAESAKLKIDIFNFYKHCSNSINVFNIYILGR